MRAAALSVLIGMALVARIATAFVSDQVWHELTDDEARSLLITASLSSAAPCTPRPLLALSMPTTLQGRGLLFASLNDVEDVTNQINLAVGTSGKTASASRCLPDDGAWYLILSYGLPNGVVTDNYQLGPLR